MPRVPSVKAASANPWRGTGNGSARIDADGNAAAPFYAAGENPTGAAAGIVNGDMPDFARARGTFRN